MLKFHLYHFYMKLHLTFRTEKETTKDFIIRYEDSYVWYTTYRQEKVKSTGKEDLELLVEILFSYFPPLYLIRLYCHFIFRFSIFLCFSSN